MRRANGTGTVVKLSGNRRRPYAVRVSVRDKYGRLVQKAVSYHAKLSEPRPRWTPITMPTIPP